MPASWPSGRNYTRSGAGAPQMSVLGVTRLEPRTPAGMSGRSAPVGNRFTSGGPTFNSQAQQFRGRFVLGGVTRDSAGAPLAGCDVHLFQTGSDRELGQTTSDGSGVYSFIVGDNASQLYVVATKAGSPNVAGVSDTTLSPVAV